MAKSKAHSPRVTLSDEPPPTVSLSVTDVASHCCLLRPCSPRDLVTFARASGKCLPSVFRKPINHIYVLFREIALPSCPRLSSPILPLIPINPTLVTHNTHVQDGQRSWIKIHSGEITLRCSYPILAPNACHESVQRRLPKRI